MMPRILTKLRIDEVSAVDRGAGDGVKIVLMKRDDTPRSKPHLERYQRRLRKLRESRSFNEIIKQARQYGNLAADGRDVQQNPSTSRRR
jgi:hypothetical protein